VDPKSQLFGAQTEAAVRNFPISSEPVTPRLLRALAHVKAAAAVANAAATESTGVAPDMADAIVAAADEVIDGRWIDQFPVDVFQTGSGTSTNMNMNEVLATLAAGRLGRPVHPNDHVNASQSTNDTFPTAIRIAALDALHHELVPALELLDRELGLKAEQFATIVKAGRTHLMDATPIMLGQEFSGYRSQVHESNERLQSVTSRVAALPLGGTATGNGLNAPAGFAAAAIAGLCERTGLPLTEAEDHFAVQGSQDALVELAAQLRGVAVTMFKIAADIRLMASGPRTGLGEIVVPSLQPGSSIMPGKVNPVICEVVLQVSVQVIGHDATVAFAGTQGNLELNVFLPVIARNLLESIELLAAAARVFAEKCIVGIEPDVERCRQHADATLAVAAALNLEIGYDAAVRVVAAAISSGRSIRETVVAEGLLDEETANRLLDLETMAQGTVTTPRPFT
jgi:fumarate hydratase class II